MKPKKRRLAAIMFTDIVGYSAIMQQSEEMANRLRMRHREVFNRVTAQYGGEILQYFGDGTLSIFPSATAAAECGVALQQALKKEPKVPLRIGIHTGEITFSEEEIYGDGVNIAARLESLCVPGGIFISGKVYDDIKNHARLRAKSLGYYQLKNIQREMEVYAISNAGVTVPEFELQAPQAMGASAPSAAAAAPAAPAEAPVGRKRKGVAFVLALLLGIFGAHRFYLDQRGRGIAHLVIFFLAAIANILPDEAVAILAIIGFIDAMIFLAMPRADFDARYNSGAQASQRLQKTQRQQTPASDTKQILRGQFSQHLSKAVSLHRNYDYEGAMEYLHKALDIKYDAPEVHFLLACCYSSSEDAERSLHHLDLAVAFGLKNADDRIKTHGDLSYLRVQPQFEAFAEHGYRLPKELPKPSPSLLEDEETGLILPAAEDEEIEGLEAEKQPLRRDEERPEG